jgi:hypothetical protein
MGDDVLPADEQPATSQAERRRRSGWVDRGLRVATAAALGVDAYVHAHDAGFYDFHGGGAISQGNLFRVEAAVAGLLALLLLAWRRPVAWLLAFAVAASALGAVLLYRYVDVGVLGPLPNMYEPTWGVSGKLLSAYAEGTAVLISAAGMTLAVGRSRRLKVRRPPAPAHQIGAT